MATSGTIDPAGPEDSENGAAFDQSRAALYRLLSALYLKEITPLLLDELKRADFFGTAAEAGVPFPGIEGDASRLCGQLEIEYARLFVGPGQHVPPCGSVYRDDDDWPGQLWGSTTAELRRFMEHYGMKLSTPGPIPDHIGVLFEFMATVIDGRLEADRQGNAESVTTAESLQRTFFRKYIDPWVDRFMSKVQQANPLPFYHATLELTRLHLDQERALLDQIGRESSP